VATAALFAWVGWRLTWSVFGLLTLVLVVLPALIFMRRSPEEMGLQPDGMDAPSAPVGSKPKDDMKARLVAEEAVWTWREVIRTKAFWII
jgi:hypothetical protein